MPSALELNRGADSIKLTESKPVILFVFRNNLRISALFGDELFEFLVKRDTER